MAKSKRSRAPSRMKMLDEPEAKPSRKGAGITARRAFAVTPQKIHDNAQFVRIRKESAGLSSSAQPQIIFDTKSQNPTTQRRPENHRTVVRLLDRQYKRLWLSCSCEYWLFYCEYAHAKIGSSDIIFSNGEPSVVTNPKAVPWLCKHTIRVLSRDSTVKKLVKLDKKFADIQH